METAEFMSLGSHKTMNKHNLHSVSRGEGKLLNPHGIVTYGGEYQNLSSFPFTPFQFLWVIKSLFGSLHRAYF